MEVKCVTGCVTGGIGGKWLKSLPEGRMYNEKNNPLYLHVISRSRRGGFTSHILGIGNNSPGLTPENTRHIFRYTFRILGLKNPPGKRLGPEGRSKGKTK